MDNGLLIGLLVGVGFPAIAGIIAGVVARIMPKEKAKKIGDGLGFGHGKLISNIGNTRIGKKAMDQIEEGPITTGIAFLIAYLGGILRGLGFDDIKQQVEKKIDSDIQKAFNGAVKELKK